MSGCSTGQTAVIDGLLEAGIRLKVQARRRYLGLYDRGRPIAGAPVLDTEIETLDSGFSDISRNPSFVISSPLFYFACNTEGGAGQRL